MTAKAPANTFLGLTEVLVSPCSGGGNEEGGSGNWLLTNHKLTKTLDTR